MMLSIPRFLLPSFNKSAVSGCLRVSLATTAAPKSKPSHYSQRCPHLRNYSNKRLLQTTTAQRPSNLDVESPPRNHGVPDTSIAGSIPQVHDTRPPDISGQFTSIPEGEAQKSTVEYLSVSQTKAPEMITDPKPQKKSRLRPRKAAMTLTPTAIAHLKELLSEPTPRLIRVGVRNRGCSGLAYHLEYVEKPGPFDETVEQDGVKVLIDSKALFSIIGSEMDWLEDKLNERFIFRNPNIKEQCGCGESFMV